MSARSGTSGEDFAGEKSRLRTCALPSMRPSRVSRLPETCAREEGVGASADCDERVVVGMRRWNASHRDAYRENDVFRIRESFLGEERKRTRGGVVTQARLHRGRQSRFAVADAGAWRFTRFWLWDGCGI